MENSKTISEQYKNLQAANKEITKQRDRANLERDRANSERDRANSEFEKAEMARVSLEKANDSIKMQSYLLSETNKNLIREHYRMLVSQSKAIANKAFALVNDGDIITAIQLLMEIIPEYSHGRPYSPEPVQALRFALDIYDADGYKPIIRTSDSTFI